MPYFFRSIADHWLIAYSLPQGFVPSLSPGSSGLLPFGDALATILPDALRPGGPGHHMDPFQGDAFAGLEDTFTGTMETRLFLWRIAESFPAVVQRYIDTTGNAQVPWLDPRGVIMRPMLSSRLQTPPDLMKAMLECSAMLPGIYSEFRTMKGLHSFLLESGDVFVEEPMHPTQLSEDAWAHRGSLVATGQPVIIHVRAMCDSV
jgi:hypothetical protein